MLAVLVLFCFLSLGSALNTRTDNVQILSHGEASEVELQGNLYFGDADSPAQDAMVPVGGVTAWIPVPANAEPPQGWVICDGRTIENEKSPFNGTPTPDFRSRFILGAEDSTTTGLEMGSESHSHTSATKSHIHSTSHNHENIDVTVHPSGSHKHIAAKYDASTKTWTSHSERGTELPMPTAYKGVVFTGTGTYPLGSVKTDVEMATKNDTMDHSHTFATTASEDIDASTSFSATSDLSSDEASNSPRSLSVVYIMRIF